MAYGILTEHSRYVADKALEVARRVPDLNPDSVFIEEAALLHDIGIIFVDAPEIGCHGKPHYMFHGVLGRAYLEKQGFPAHALVCERHVVAGITQKAILERNLGLPLRDMVPVTLEETIISFADKFFSKTPGALGKEKSVDDILKQLAKYGENQVPTFQSWLERFGY